MNNNLEIFKNEELGEVRVLEQNCEPWFVGKDVAEILGYKNSRKAIRDHVDEEDKGGTKWNTPSGMQEITIINESGLYSLILSSKLPSAKKFKRWVTNEVLPSIRKKGNYEVPKNPFDTLKLMFNVVEEHKEKIDKLDSRVYEIEENALLTPGEYNLINVKVSERIRNIKRELGIEHSTREQNSELYKAINSEIKTITGVRTRSQLRQKDLNKVLDFIRDWEPSKATRVVVDQLSLNFDKVN